MDEKTEYLKRCVDELYRPCPSCGAKPSEGTIRTRYDADELLSTWWCVRCGFAETTPTDNMQIAKIMQLYGTDNDTISHEIALLAKRLSEVNKTVIFIPQTMSLWRRMDLPPEIRVTKLEIKKVRLDEDQ
jgi:hypothetical protein